MFVLFVSIFCLLVQAEEFPGTEDRFRNCTVGTQVYDCGLELICNSQGWCDYCTSDKQCRDEQLSCESPNSEVNFKLCRHKELIPMNYIDFLGIFTVILGGILASGGGLGGGAIYTPIFLILMKFTAHAAIPLSKATVFGGAIAALTINYPLRHPSADRPLIDYKLVLLLLPMTLAGTTLGVFMNIISPTWFIIVLLILILGFTTFRSSKKGIQMYRKENHLRAKLEDDGSQSDSDTPVDILDETPDALELQPHQNHGHIIHDLGDSSEVFDPFATTYDEPEPPADSQDTSSETEVSNSDSDTVANTSKGIISSQRISPRDSSEQLRSPDSYPEPLASLLRSEKKLTLRELGLFLFFWSVILIIALFRGGHGQASVVGIESCSAGSWILFALVPPFCIFSTLIICKKLLKDAEIRQQNGYEWLPGDILWEKRNLIKYPLYAFIGGTASGLIGVGGGVVFGPVMLELHGPKGHISPDVVVATSATMVLATSSSTTTQFLIHGVLPPSYAILFVFVGLVSNIIGKRLIRKLVTKYNRRSIVIFTIALGIFVSMVMMLISGTIDVISTISSGRYMGFRPVCG